MKRAPFALLASAGLVLASGAQANTPFCDGWAAGYKAGYCYHKQFCTPPVPPYCPYPSYGETTYQDGYNKGFTAGLAAG